VWEENGKIGGGKSWVHLTMGLMKEMLKDTDVTNDARKYNG
jgi:hypothetical protein